MILNTQSIRDDKQIEVDAICHWQMQSHGNSTRYESLDKLGMLMDKN